MIPSPIEKLILCSSHPFCLFISVSGDADFSISRSLYRLFGLFSEFFNHHAQVFLGLLKQYVDKCISMFNNNNYVMSLIKSIISLCLFSIYFYLLTFSICFFENSQPLFAKGNNEHKFYVH